MFDRKYLRGRWFKNSDQGRKWVIAGLFWQKIMGINRNIPWPTGPNVRINNPNNIEFDPDDLNNFWSLGLFLDATHAKIHIGKNTFIGPFTTITTTERDFKNPAIHNNWAPIHIGNNCWIGANSVILPGVELGDNTIVGAGSVVTHSHPEGHCLIAGNPAKKLRDL